jgi:hypothetical protein
MKKFENECKQSVFFPLLNYNALLVLFRRNKKVEKGKRKLG